MYLIFSDNEEMPILKDESKQKVLEEKWAEIVAHLGHGFTLSKFRKEKK